MIDQALLSLRPGAEWTLNGDTYAGLVWLDQKQSKPTQEEIDAEIARLQQYYQSIEYQKNRSKEYPLLGDQLDMLWHAIDQGNLDKTSNFYLSLKQIKDKYPKG